MVEKCSNMKPVYGIFKPHGGCTLQYIVYCYTSSCFCSLHGYKHYKFLFPEEFYSDNDHQILFNVLKILPTADVRTLSYPTHYLVP